LARILPATRENAGKNSHPVTILAKTSIIINMLRIKPARLAGKQQGKSFPCRGLGRETAGKMLKVPILPPRITCDFAAKMAMWQSRTRPGRVAISRRLHKLRSEL
jgi:hypothetical protein